MKADAGLPRAAFRRLAAACVFLLVLSVALSAAVNTLRPEDSRLPWVGDWDRHIETLAFRAGIPVTFLNGVRTRVIDGQTVVADARVPAEYAAGHLPGAVSLPVAEVEWRLLPLAERLTPDTPVLVYCGGADCEDALDLALKLRDLGFSDLTLYPGGFAEWTAYGGAVQPGEQP